MILRYEGNQLFYGSEEIVEWACGKSHNPAHYQKILCAGSSPNGERIISVDEGRQIKVWDPSRARLEMRVWEGKGPKNISAIAITQDGTRMALACDLQVTIYDLVPNKPPTELEKVSCSLQNKIVFMVFLDSDSILCHDSDGGKVTIKRDPSWKVS